jgi:hypothetical protein
VVVRRYVVWALRLVGGCGGANFDEDQWRPPSLVVK